MLGSSLRGNIALVVNVPADTWPVEVDVAEFELALLNVAVNARDAMAEGGTLTLSARNVAGVPGRTEGRARRRFVELTLSDTGGGIAPDMLPRIFDPFFTTKAVGKGTGLGLSQVYGFVRQSGGAIAVKSELGSGTTITMYLPRSRAARSPKPQPRETASSGRARADTILVVEDNPEVADVTVDPARSARLSGAAGGERGRGARDVARRRDDRSRLQRHRDAGRHERHPSRPGGERAPSRRFACCSPPVTARWRRRPRPATGSCASRSRSQDWSARCATP